MAGDPDPGLQKVFQLIKPSKQEFRQSCKPMNFLFVKHLLVFDFDPDRPHKGMFILINYQFVLIIDYQIGGSSKDQEPPLLFLRNHSVASNARIRRNTQNTETRSVYFF